MRTQYGATRTSTLAAASFFVMPSRSLWAKVTIGGARTLDEGDGLGKHRAVAGENAFYILRE